MLGLGGSGVAGVGRSARSLDTVDTSLSAESARPAADMSLVCSRELGRDLQSSPDTRLNVQREGGGLLLLRLHDAGLLLHLGRGRGALHLDTWVDITIYISTYLLCTQPHQRHLGLLHGAEPGAPLLATLHHEAAADVLAARASTQQVSNLATRPAPPTYAQTSRSPPRHAGHVPVPALAGLGADNPDVVSGVKIFFCVLDKYFYLCLPRME